jgi:hypothetical protein
LVVERNFIKFFDDCTHDSFRKLHEPSLQVRDHGEVALEGSSTASNTNPRAEDEGVITVESSGWLDDDGSR